MPRLGGSSFGVNFTLKDRSLHAKRSVVAIALVAFLLAAMIRVFWVLEIMDPFSAIVSDMLGYVERARNLIAGRLPEPKRLQAIWPFGAHVYYAVIFTLAGGEANTVAVRILHALFASLHVPLIVWLGQFVLRSTWALSALGFFVATWSPLISYAGFFSSEAPFSTLSTAATVGLVLFTTRQRSDWFAAALTSFLCGCAIVVRPEFSMTLALAAPLLLRRTWRELSATRLHVLIAFTVPLLSILTFSAMRMKFLTGHYGLVSDNGPVTRLFGETDYLRVHAKWEEGGGSYYFVLVPPQKNLTGDRAELNMQGYICDEEILDRKRKEFIATQTVWQRVSRYANNIWVLVGSGTTWPENDYARSALRNTLQQVNAGIMYGALTPLFLIGIGLAYRSRRTLSERGRAALYLCSVPFITVAYAGAVYYGEARHRVPYDGLIWMFALVTIERIASWVARRQTKLHSH